MYMYQARFCRKPSAVSLCNSIEPAKQCFRYIIKYLGKILALPYPDIAVEKRCAAIISGDFRFNTQIHVKNLSETFFCNIFVKTVFP